MRNSNDEQSSLHDNCKAENDLSVDESRRAALQKLGLYGAYTAPALLGLFASTKAAHASPPILNPPGSGLEEN